MRLQRRTLLQTAPLVAGLLLVALFLVYAARRAGSIMSPRSVSLSEVRSKSGVDLPEEAELLNSVYDPGTPPAGTLLAEIAIPATATDSFMDAYAQRFDTTFARGRLPDVGFADWWPGGRDLDLVAWGARSEPGSERPMEPPVLIAGVVRDTPDRSLLYLYWSR